MTKISDILLQVYISAVKLFLRIRIMLEDWKKMKQKYENNEITKEALQDWKAKLP